MAKTFSTEGVVLKRINFSEADRIVTIFTKDFGKITGLAKGVRKTSSRKKGGLEPATHSRCLFIERKGMPLITQTHIMNSFSGNQANLVVVTQTFQMLEIVDALTVDGEENGQLYLLLIDILKKISQGMGRQEQVDGIKSIVAALGYGPPTNFEEYDLKEYIQELSNKNLKTKQFLTTTATNTIQ